MSWCKLIKNDIICLGDIMGEIIRNYRIKRNYTQEELAEIIDISTRQLQRIENGESITKIKTLKKVINVLKIEDKDIIAMIKN